MRAGAHVSESLKVRSTIIAHIHDNVFIHLIAGTVKFLLKYYFDISGASSINFMEFRSPQAPGQERVYLCPSADHRLGYQINSQGAVLCDRDGRIPLSAVYGIPDTLVP